MRTHGERAFELMQRAPGIRQVGFVDDEDVGDLDEPGLHGLDVVAEPRRGGEHAHVGDVDDVDLALAGADGLDEDQVFACRVEHIDDAHGRGRQAAEVASARQRAHEYAVVVECGGHAHAVAEDGAAGDRAGRIDGNDADGASEPADVCDQRVDERGFAGARRAGEADDDCVSQMRTHGLEQSWNGGRQALQLGGDASDGGALASAHPCDEGWGVGWLDDLGASIGHRPLISGLNAQGNCDRPCAHRTSGRAPTAAQRATVPSFSSGRLPFLAASP